MKRKNFKKIVIACVAALCMSSTAFAAEAALPQVGTTPTGNSVKITVTNNLIMAEGIEVPEVNFDFAVQKVTPDAPDAAIEQIRYGKNDNKGISDNGKYTISKKGNITFGEFPHAGEYVYKISERAGTIAGIEYSKDKYVLRVQVENGQTGNLQVKSVTAEKGTENGTAENKVGEIAFANTYRKAGALTVTKVTEGKMANKKKAFNFEIELTPSATETEAHPVYTAKLGQQILNFGPGKSSFSLKDGESLVFDNLPAGTKYIVTEIGEKDGYIPRVEVVSNGLAERPVAGADEGNLASSKAGHFVGERENKVTYVNTYNDVPVTGVMGDNMPFVLMVVIGVATIFALILARKRKASNK